MCVFHYAGHRSAHRHRSGADPQHEFVRNAIRFGSAVMMCLAIWLLTGAGYFWPGWVIVIGGLKLGLEARAAFNGAPEDDAADQRDFTPVA